MSLVVQGKAGLVSVLRLDGVSCPMASLVIIIWVGALGHTCLADTNAAVWWAEKWVDSG